MPIRVCFLDASFHPILIMLRVRYYYLLHLTDRETKGLVLCLWFHNQEVEVLGSKPRSDSNTRSTHPGCFPLVDKVGFLWALWRMAGGETYWEDGDSRRPLIISWQSPVSQHPTKLSERGDHCLCSLKRWVCDPWPGISKLLRRKSQIICKCFEIRVSVTFVYIGITGGLG